MKRRGCNVSGNNGTIFSRKLSTPYTCKTLVGQKVKEVKLDPEELRRAVKKVKRKVARKETLHEQAGNFLRVGQVLKII